MRWFVGSDHAGFALKRHLCELLRGLGDEVADLGTDSEQSVDYPDYGAAVGRAVASARTPTLGLIICGTGVGISIAANKVPGVRGALCTEAFTATASRAHNAIATSAWPTHPPAPAARPPRPMPPPARPGPARRAGVAPPPPRGV